MYELNRKKLFSFITALLIIAILTGAYTLSKTIENANNPALVVIRIDDIQDYAFRDAQLYLMKQARQSGMPLSLAVIPTFFGEDHELVEAVKQTIVSGSEVTAHGWEHENLSQYSLSEQETMLLEAKQFLQETLNSEINVLVPPMFSYNNDTVAAMEATDFTIVSGLTEYHEKGWASEQVQSIPATIELCNLSDNVWTMKSKEAVMSELQASIDDYGYAIIVTHPQEFIADSKLNPDVVSRYEQILQAIAQNYSFNTIEGLSKALD